MEVSICFNTVVHCSYDINILHTCIISPDDLRSFFSASAAKSMEAPIWGLAINENRDTAEEKTV